MGFSLLAWRPGLGLYYGRIRGIESRLEGAAHCTLHLVYSQVKPSFRQFGHHFILRTFHGLSGALPLVEPPVEEVGEEEEEVEGEEGEEVCSPALLGLEAGLRL